MEFELIPLREAEKAAFKRAMQEAFQRGAEACGGPLDAEVLPESHIDRSLQAEGSAAYAALAGGELAGGAIVVIDEKTQHNRLDFLFVKHGAQNKGIGRRIWKAVEALHSDTKVWETCTPYFDRRNIHFYVNCCGFHAVEFFNRHHPDPSDSDSAEGSGEDGFDGMFRLEKAMQGGI